MRLYRRHDVDLMMLHLLSDERFSLQAHTKAALLARVLQKPFESNLPNGKMSFVDMPKSAYLHIDLDENVEDERLVAEFLKEIPEGLRNGFIKHTIRYYSPSLSCIRYLQQEKVFDFKREESYGNTI